MKLNSEHKPNVEHVPLLVSFSGGRTSAFMAKYLKERYPERQMFFVFANTGKEREETLEFVNECDKRWGLNVVWVEAKVIFEENVGTTFRLVNFENASRNGEPFENAIKKYGIPNKSHAICTRELKLRPTRAYMKSLGCEVYEQAMGIRFDEVHRINWQRAKEENLIYPLATELRVNKEFIRNWWDKQDFDLQLKDYEGNCDMCFKKSERKLMTLILEKPELINWWNEMEIKYSSDDRLFYRGYKTVQDLIEQAKKPFRKAMDSHEKDKQQKSMFDYELDLEYDCFCKST